MMNYLDQIEEILSFGKYSPNTIQSYKTYTAPFLEYCAVTLHKAPADVSPAEIRAFICQLQAERSLSDNSTNHALSELRFLYEAVLGLPWNTKQMPHRRQTIYLPYVPTPDIVEAFISSIHDLKKKAMVSLMYSAGLRISEVCTLKCAHIEHSRSRIYVAPGKNCRDRYTILSEEAFSLLCSYWRALPGELRTRDWLFTQQRSIGKPIYPQFIQDLIPKQESLLGWPHRLTCHSFRHAFATHSYQNGMDLETLSRLLGHSSVNSTRIYVHLAMLSMEGIKSPMDGMGVAK